MDQPNQIDDSKQVDKWNGSDVSPDLATNTNTIAIDEMRAVNFGEACDFRP